MFKSITSTNEEFVFESIKDGRLTLQMLYQILSNCPVQLQCAQLRFMQNKSYCQIGDIRGCAAAAARLNVKYAMEKIIKYLEREKEAQ
jgi:hypothetical protein